jgi:hypothetical protein
MISTGATAWAYFPGGHGSGFENPWKTGGQPQSKTPQNNQPQNNQPQNNRPQNNQPQNKTPQNNQPQNNQPQNNRPQNNPQVVNDPTDLRQENFYPDAYFDMQVDRK